MDEKVVNNDKLKISISRSVSSFEIKCVDACVNSSQSRARYKKTVEKINSDQLVSPNAHIDGLMSFDFNYENDHTSHEKSYRSDESKSRDTIENFENLTIKDDSILCNINSQVLRSKNDIEEYHVENIKDQEALNHKNICPRAIDRRKYKAVGNTNEIFFGLYPESEFQSINENSHSEKDKLLCSESPKLSIHKGHPDKESKHVRCRDDNYMLKSNRNSFKPILKDTNSSLLCDPKLKKDDEENQRKNSFAVKDKTFGKS